MGANLYAKFEREIPSVDPNGSDRVFICKNPEELDALAKILGVNPLSSFFSYSEEEFKEMGMEAPPGISVQWFEPRDVSITLRALAANLEEISGLYRSDDVRAELAELAQLADSAALNGTRIRFYIGL